jgi:hypothetical protein
MAVYNAGEAQAIWSLNTSKGDANLDRLEKRLRELDRLQKEVFKSQSSGGGGSLPSTPRQSGGGADPAVAQQRAERAILARASAEARLAQVQNTGESAALGLAQAQQIYQNALAKVDRTSVDAIRTTTQLTAVQNRLAKEAGGGLPVLPRTLEKFGTEALGQLKDGLLGIVGPAALVTAGIGLAGAAIGSFFDAFKEKASLDATTRSIETNLAGVRDSTQVFAEATAFADKYRLTQRETADILAASTDTLRTSTASVSELESALLRLQSRDVSKPVSEAARALRELQSGDVTSIKELFNVPAREANRMKDEIAGGADAVAVLNDYLDRAGISMQVLENRAKGAAGAMNEQAIAQEQLGLAQAEFGEGPGIAIVRTKVAAYQALTDMFDRNAKASFGLSAAFGIEAAQALFGANAAAKHRLETENTVTATQKGIDAATRKAAADDLNKVSIAGVTDATLKDLQAKVDSADKTQQLALLQAQLSADSALAAQGLLGAGDQAVILAGKYGIATSEAQKLILAQQGLANAEALADQRKQEQTGTNLSAKQFDTFSKLQRSRIQENAEFQKEANADALADQRKGEQANTQQSARQFDALSQLQRRQAQENAAAQKQANEKAAAEQQRLASAQRSLDLANARTDADKIAVYKRQLAGTTDAAERLQIQAQIAQIQNAAGKGGAATKANPQLKGLNALQTDSIKLAGDHQEQLDRANQLLAKGNLTEHQRNQLLLERADLEEKISAEKDKQTRATIDASLGAVRDQQERIKEAREIAGLERQLQSGRFSGQQQEIARLRLAEITFEQQKRALDIQKDIKDAGGVLTPVVPGVSTGTPALSQALPLPNVAALPPALPQAGVNLSLTIQLDPTTGKASVVNPQPGVNVIDVLVTSGIKG